MHALPQQPASQDTRSWYDNYYRRKGVDRNDLLTNPETLFQYLAFEASVLSALRRTRGLVRRSSKILDVGCGSGGSLVRFMQLGFSPENLHGIDILEDRVHEARRTYPNVEFVCEDAAAMPYESGIFDLTMESTMFVQITDRVLAERIAGEMLRVTKAGGYLLLIDWRYGKPGNRDYAALSRKRIKHLFSVGRLADVVCQEQGALVPPVGRAASKYFPAAYFPLRSILPFLVGSRATLLAKR